MPYPVMYWFVTAIRITDQLKMRAGKLLARIESLISGYALAKNALIAADRLPRKTAGDSAMTSGWVK